MPDAFTDLVREMRILQQIPYNEVTQSILNRKGEVEKKVDAALDEADRAAHAPAPGDEQLAMSFDEI